MESNIRGSTPRKSILKAKSKTSGNLVRGSVSTPGNKKKVEITIPPLNRYSYDDIGISFFDDTKLHLRETPIPRVAFLARSPQVASKPKSAKKSSKKSSKRSLISTGSSSHKKKKSSKKKIKSKSASSPDVPSDAPYKQVPANAGLVYIKELGTINEILKSVADPSTHAGHETELIEGMIRPFSAVELQQLLDSIGNVATIHKQIPGGSEAAEAVRKGMKGSKSKYKRKKKKEAASKTTTAADLLNLSQPATSDPLVSVSLPEILKIKTPKSSKSKRSTKSVSKSKTTNKKSLSATVKKKSIPVKPSTAPATENPTKPSIKSLYKPLNLKPKVSKKKTKKKATNNEERRSSDSILSELSELDLVKSAMLNKRFYEESMALERRASRSESKSQTKTTTKKRNKSRDTLSNSSKHSSINLSPVNSLVVSSISSKSEAGEKSPPLTDLKNLEDNLEASNKHPENDFNQKSMKDVLINHSHVIRDPEFRRVSYPIESQRHNNRGYVNPRPIPFKVDVDLDEIQGFDKHLQKIKYPGAVPEAQGLLDIPPLTNKLLENATELTGKYLRNERILEETRNKAAVGLSKKDSIKQEDTEVTNPVVRSFHQDIAKPAVVNREKHTTSKGHKPRSKGKRHGKTEGFFNKIHKKSGSNAPKTSEGKKHVEPIIQNIAKAPSKWEDNSLSSSRDQLNTGEGGSRWTTLNQKTVSKNREIKSRSLGRRRDFPQENLDAIERTLNSDDRKKYLENVAKMRAKFDTYDAYYIMKEQEALRNPPEPVPKYQYSKPYGVEQVPK